MRSAMNLALSPPGWCMVTLRLYFIHLHLHLMPRAHAELTAAPRLAASRYGFIFSCRCVQCGNWYVWPAWAAASLCWCGCSCSVSRVRGVKITYYVVINFTVIKCTPTVKRKMCWAFHSKITNPALLRLSPCRPAPVACVECAAARARRRTRHGSRRHTTRPGATRG